MKHLTQLVFIVTLLFSAGVLAYDFGPGNIDIPAGFAGQDTKKVRDLGIIHKFVKKHPDKDIGTLLQITVYDFGQKLRPVPESMMLAAAEGHLLDFTAGLRRHFDKFDYKQMKSLKIDNTPTAHVEWTGNSNGRPMHGTAYCLIKGSKVIIFHVKDISEAPLDNTIQALTVLSAVKLKD